jgi:hypothetical protein
MEIHFEKRVNYGLEQRLHFIQPPFSREQTFQTRLPGGGGQFLKRERRTETRIAHSFQTRVWGIDIDQEAFGLDCALDNISPSGLHLRVPLQIKSLSRISLVVRLLNGSREGATAAIKGKVIRDEPETNGVRGVAVLITECCFF